MSRPRHLRPGRPAGGRRQPPEPRCKPHLPAAGADDLRNRAARVRGRAGPRGVGAGRRRGLNCPMRILVVAHRVPYPPNRGDKIATYHYIRHLARRHEVSVACLADGKGDLDNVAGLAPLARSVDAVVCAPVRRRARALAALAGSRPLTAAYFDEPELRAKVRSRLTKERFDVA